MRGRGVRRGIGQASDAQYIQSRCGVCIALLTIEQAFGKVLKEGGAA